MEKHPRKANNKPLRQKAEEEVARKSGKSPESVLQDLPAVAHELRVRQAELEVQNRELRKSQTELTEARDKYHSLFDSVPVGYFILDKHNRILEINRTAAELLTATKEGLYNQRFTSFINNGHLSLFYTQTLRAFREDRKTRIELEMMRRDRSRFIALLHVVPVKDEGGELSQLRISVADVTETRQREKALGESESKYRGLFENMTEGFVLGEIILDLEGKPYDFRFLEANRSWEKWAGISREKAVGMTYRERIPEISPEIIQMYGEVALTGEPRRAEIYSPNTDTWIHVYAYSPARNRFAVIIADITERRKEREEREQLAEKRQHLLDLARLVIAEKDLGALLTRVAKAAQALTGARMATCGHGYVNGRFTTAGAYWKEGESACPPGESFHMERGGVYMDLLDDKESIRLSQEELEKHPAWWGLPADHAPLRGLLGARLIDREGKANGMIMVSDKISGDFTEQDQYFLRELATIASLALQHVEARQEVENKAKELETKVKERTRELARANEELRLYALRITQTQEAERARLARELHDDTAQHLALLSLEVSSLLEKRDLPSEKVTEKLKQLKEDADRAIKDVRRYSHELMPTLLEQAGLAAALEQLVEETREMTGLDIEYEAGDEECTEDSDKMLALFRIAQEALTNIRKHSGATRAEIRLKCEADSIELIVRDNGKGFKIRKESRNALERGSMGLLSMKERARLVGAELRLESRPGKGTTVAVKIAVSSL